MTAVLVVASAGTLLGLGTHCCSRSPRHALAEVLSSPVTVVLFAVLVGMTALNVLTDSVFLALDWIWSFLRLQRRPDGVLKVGLPFALAGAGAFGLYGSVGLAVAACAAGASGRSCGSSRAAPALPSPELLANRGFAGAATSPTC